MRKEPLSKLHVDAISRVGERVRCADTVRQHVEQSNNDQPCN